MLKIHLREKTAIWGGSLLSIHWLNTFTSWTEKSNLHHMGKCMCRDGQQPAQTGSHLVQKMNEVEIEIQKSRAGRVKENKKETCFQTKTYPRNITGLILGGDTEAVAGRRKGKVSRRDFLYLESHCLLTQPWLLPPGPSSSEKASSARGKIRFNSSHH